MGRRGETFRTEANEGAFSLFGCNSKLSTTAHTSRGRTDWLGAARQQPSEGDPATEMTGEQDGVLPNLVLARYKGPGYPKWKHFPSKNDCHIWK